MNRFCYARVRPPSQPRRSLEWRLGEEIGPSYAVGSSVSRGSNGTIACYLCAALPPFMPPAAAGHLWPTSTVAAACALDVLAGGGELEDPRPWATRGAAEPASALPLAAPLARPLPLRAWGGAPDMGLGSL